MYKSRIIKGIAVAATAALLGLPAYAQFSSNATIIPQGDSRACLTYGVIYLDLGSNGFDGDLDMVIKSRRKCGKPHCPNDIFVRKGIDPDSREVQRHRLQTDSKVMVMDAGSQEFVDFTIYYADCKTEAAKSLGSSKNKDGK